MFDIRQDTKWKGQPLFGDRYKTSGRSVTHLGVVNDWQMVVSTISGDVRRLMVLICSMLEGADKESCPIMQRKARAAGSPIC
jgi:hypothetical protein